VPPFALSPITDHRSPITDHRSPITDHRSPITDHRSPITGAPRLRPSFETPEASSGKPASPALPASVQFSPGLTVFGQIRTGQAQPMLANFEALRLCLSKMNSRWHFLPGQEHFWIFGPEPVSA
jgi:hypothetical protein